MKRTITSIKENEALEYARYTVYNRVMPSLIDGFKPVQRFFFHSTKLNARDEFKKVSGIGGVVSDYGYAHGEGSCQSAGQGMAAEWNNNIRVIEGSGSFGTRMIKEAAAPRYTKVRLAAICDKLFKDDIFAPPHADLDHTPPKFYLPIIPLALVNGSSGIAVGYKQEIIPRDPIQLIDSMVKLIEGGTYDRPDIKFPEFTGTVTSTLGEYGHIFEVTGHIEYDDRKRLLTISEIPPSYDRNKYIAVLEKLKDKKLIRDYEDESSNGFRYIIKPNVGYEFDYFDAIQMFSLSERYHENILVINVDDKLQHYQSEMFMILDFIKYRLTIYVERKNHYIQTYARLLEKNKAILKFIKSVINKEVDISKMNIKQATDWVVANILNGTLNDEIIKAITSIRIFDITNEMVDRLVKTINSNEHNLEYWNNVDINQLYVEDLLELKAELC